MEGVRKDLEERTVQFVRDYLKENIDPEDLFYSTGYAYIRLAKEEPNLYRIYFTYKRQGIASLEELYQKVSNPEMAAYLVNKFHISEEKAKALHMNMLIYTQGMGAILAITEPGISEEEARGQLWQAFDVFLQKAREEE